MKKTTRSRPLFAAGVFVSALVLTLNGCGSEDADTAHATPDASYTTQGRVVMIKTPGSPASGLKIHHEAIPNFVDGEGKVVGMPSHPMDFPRVAPGIDADTLKVGDAVRFTFDVTWQPSPTWVISNLERLPDDTRFAFEAQPDPADEPVGADEPEQTPDPETGG